MRNPSEEYDRLHDHCQAIARERDYANHQLDEVRRLLDETTKQLHQSQDELNLTLEALVRYRNPPTDNGVNWRNIATMLSHFDVCTSARIECNICHEARQAYLVGLTT